MAETSSQTQSEKPSSTVTDVGVRPKPATIAIVLSGGGAKGDFEVGVVRYLYSRGVRPNILAGTSVGAINALKLAEGEYGTPSSPDIPGHIRGLAGLEEIWQQLWTENSMWEVDPYFLDAANTIKKIYGEDPVDLKPLIDAASQIEPTAWLAVATWPAGPLSPYQAFLAYYLFQTAEALKPLQHDVEVIAADLKLAQSLANLKPIFAKMSQPSTFNFSDLKQSKIVLRLAMVALEDGKIRYATENSVLIERDGTPTMHVILDPACAKPIQDEIATLQSELENAPAPQHPDKTTAGKPDPEDRLMRAKIAALKAQLEHCPKQNVPQEVDLLKAALASSSIPSIFPSVQIGPNHYVDGGVRMLAPVEAAVKAGATFIYAVGAAPKLVTPSQQNWDIASTALRVSEDIMTNEIALSDFFPLNGWGVPTMVIMPEQEIHDTYTIDPGLIRISMAYGYMRADDTFEAYSKDPEHYQDVLATYSTQRLATKISLLRKQIWAEEIVANGRKYYPVEQLPPTPSSCPLVNPSPDRAYYDYVRFLKLQLKSLVEQRLNAKGKCPTNYGQWWLEWEGHNWTPIRPLWQTLLVSCTPNKLQLNIPVTFKIECWENAESVTDANVAINGVTVGKVDQSITHTFTSKKVKTVDAQGNTDIDIELPVITVNKSGFAPIEVPVDFG